MEKSKMTISEKIDYLFGKINWNASYLDATAVEIKETFKSDVEEAMHPKGKEALKTDADLNLTELRKKYPAIKATSTKDFLEKASIKN